ncbi:hypothetical protein [Rhodohalobacter halophilus]|uniref:hypothetical protein n=1 Tax=Rhodohalobacter halophilus TaxID=1812810 RepID=UPI00114CAC08|nr:hypothetical protein [Rhodohalobacter halophilus]
MKKSFVPVNELKGPTTDLFYHELENRSVSLKRTTEKFAGILLYTSYLLLYPFIWLFLKITGVQNPLLKHRINGLNGGVIEITLINIGLSQENCTGSSAPNRVQSLLYKTGLYKLPLSKHLITGQFKLKGPQPVGERSAVKYIQRYSDFYKRYSVHPGFINPSSYYTTDTETAFEKELKFLIKQKSKRSGQ